MLCEGGVISSDSCHQGSLTWHEQQGEPWVGETGIQGDSFVAWKH